MAAPEPSDVQMADDTAPKPRESALAYFDESSGSFIYTSTLPPRNQVNFAPEDLRVLSRSEPVRIAAGNGMVAPAKLIPRVFRLWGPQGPEFEGRVVADPRDLGRISSMIQAAMRLTPGQFIVAFKEVNPPEVCERLVARLRDQIRASDPARDVALIEALRARPINRSGPRETTQIAAYVDKPESVDEHDLRKLLDDPSQQALLRKRLLEGWPVPDPADPGDNDVNHSGFEALASVLRRIYAAHLPSIDDMGPWVPGRGRIAGKQAIREDPVMGYIWRDWISEYHNVHRQGDGHTESRSEREPEMSVSDVKHQCLDAVVARDPSLLDKDNGKNFLSFKDLVESRYINDSVWSAVPLLLARRVMMGDAQGNNMKCMPLQRDYSRETSYVSFDRAHEHAGWSLQQRLADIFRLKQAPGSKVRLLASYPSFIRVLYRSAALDPLDIAALQTFCLEHDDPEKDESHTNDNVQLAPSQTRYFLAAAVRLQDVSVYHSHPERNIDSVRHWDDEGLPLEPKARGIQIFDPSWSFSDRIEQEYFLLFCLCPDLDSPPSIAVETSLNSFQGEGLPGVEEDMETLSAFRRQMFGE